MERLKVPNNANEELARDLAALVIARRTGMSLAQARSKYVAKAAKISESYLMLADIFMRFEAAVDEFRTSPTVVSSINPGKSTERIDGEPGGTRPQ